MAEIDGGRVAARQLARGGIDTVFGVVACPMIEVLAGAQNEGLKVVGCRHEMNGKLAGHPHGIIGGTPTRNPRQYSDFQ